MQVKINGEKIDLPEGSTIKDAIETSEAPYYKGCVLGLVKGTEEVEQYVNKYSIKITKGSIIIELLPEAPEEIKDTWKKRYREFENLRIRWTTSNDVAIGPIKTELEPSHVEHQYQRYPPMRGMTTPDVTYFPWKMTMAQAKYLQLTGNSVSGKEAAEMGWVAKSFPAEELEAQTMRELRALASIAPSLLAANKQSLNQTYEVMGFRTALSTGWQWHALSSRMRPGAGDFGRISASEGLKAALAWRDGPFKDEGFE